MRRRIAHRLAIALLVVGLGAARRPITARSEINPSPVTPEKSIQSTRAQAYQTGTASWYGEDFDGKPTASGEPFDMHDLTAAHPVLPLGTLVRVTNLRNRKAVVVRINDRGPVVPGRIIDLSYSAAQALQFQDRGLQKVRLDVVKRRAAKPQIVAELRPMAY
ncbi:MAG: septal ring lytic transglycosylase RlpA family protein [Acidobacteriales bacterium]|nr:septal ring lytic transglycosylase RlpA family protein [Terriglobales bacterium]